MAEDNVIVLNGNYKYDAYIGRQMPISTNCLDFTVILDGCSWIINYTNTSTVTRDKDDLGTIASCDGNNIYIVDYPSGVAQVISGSYPYCSDVHLQYIWLAFASRCVLSGSDGIAKPPFWDDIGIFTRKEYACRYQWVRNRNGTPNELMLLNDGTFWARDPTTGDVVHERLWSPYTDGYTSATGRWVNATNVDGIPLPTDFEFTAFSPKSKATASSAEDLQKMFTFHCLITNIAVSSAPQIPSKLPTNAVVFDRRFAELGYAYITYVVTNGTWPSKENARIRQYLMGAHKFSTEDEALAELGIRQIGDKLPPGRRVFRQEAAKWIILFTFVLPAIYLCVRLLRTRNINNKINKTL